MSEGFAGDFRRFFLRGLAAVLPTVLTLMIIIYVFRFVDTKIGRYINIGGVWILCKLLEAHGGGAGGSESFEALWVKYFSLWNTYFWWVGFVLAVVAIYIFGRFVASYIGRGVWRLTEQGLLRLPVLRAIYPYVKQVTDFLFSEKKIEFSRVVAVEYPHKGVWSLGLVTGAGMRVLQNSAGSSLLTVFIPSSPTPVTGYTITVRRNEVLDLPMSIDDALRFTVSAGVIMPLNQELSEAEIEQARQGVFPMLADKETTA